MSPCLRLKWIVAKARIGAWWWEARVRGFRPVHLRGKSVAGGWVRAAGHFVLLAGWWLISRTGTLR